MKTTGRTYLWMTRWEDFQHYQPERDRPPSWIKNYTRQLDDDRYLDLSAHARGLLHDLRMMFARSRGDLAMNTRRLSNGLGYRVTTPHLESLNHAGFIEFLSREALDHRLEDLYASRAPARSRRSREREREEPKAVTSTETTRANGTNGRPQDPEHIDTTIADSLATAAAAREELDW